MFDVHVYFLLLSANQHDQLSRVSMTSKHFTYVLVIHISLETPSESSVILFHLSTQANSSTIPRSSDSAPLFPSQPSAQPTERSQRAANVPLLCIRNSEASQQRVETKEQNDAQDAYNIKGGTRGRTILSYSIQ